LPLSIARSLSSTGTAPQKMKRCEIASPKSETRHTRRSSTSIINPVLMKKRSDTEIMIDVLEEAATRSGGAVPPNQLKEYGAGEMPIIIDLIQSKMVRGGVYRKDNQQMVGLQGITLEGRQFRDELIAKRDAKRLPARSK